MVRAIARQAEAERERRAKVIHAEGELQASEKLLEAAQMLAQQPQAMQLRYLQTLAEIAGEKSSTIVFPVPMDIFGRRSGRRARGADREGKRKMKRPRGAACSWWWPAPWRRGVAAAAGLPQPPASADRRCALARPPRRARRQGSPPPATYAGRPGGDGRAQGRRRRRDERRGGAAAVGAHHSLLLRHLDRDVLAAGDSEGAAVRPADRLHGDLGRRPVRLLPVRAAERACGTA